jgi:hypothetical protein
VDQRRKFVKDLNSGLWTMTELCDRYGISRKTGYKLVHRVEVEGAAGLEDRSRAPHSCPHRTPSDAEELVLAAKHAPPAVSCSRWLGRRCNPPRGKRRDELREADRARHSKSRSIGQEGLILGKQASDECMRCDSSDDLASEASAPVRWMRENADVCHAAQERFGTGGSNGGTLRQNYRQRRFGGIKVGVLPLGGGDRCSKGLKLGGCAARELVGRGARWHHGFCVPNEGRPDEDGWARKERLDYPWVEEALG